MSANDADGTTPTPRGSNGASVVVGFDDSPSGRAALLHARDEARLRGVSLHVVTAFEPPQQWAYAYGVTLLPHDEVESAVRSHAERGVEEVLGPVAGGEPAVEVSAVAGPAIEVLLERSREAALLVVGHRGRGAVTSTLLGSVGQSCVLHASCPVTVVPTTDDGPKVNERAPSRRPGEEPDRAPLPARS